MNKTENTAYYTLQLVNGTTILCMGKYKYPEVFVMENPIRPIIVDGQIGYTKMNPYTDDVFFEILREHYISINPMKDIYIKVYEQALEKMNNIATENSEYEFSDSFEMKETQGTLQ